MHYFFKKRTSQDDFAKARTQALDSGKWFLINIQDVDEFESHLLNRDVWKDEIVQDIVKERFVFWQRTCASSDGGMYVSRYAANINGNLPHIAVLDPRTGRCIKSWTAKTFGKTNLAALDCISSFLDTCGETPLKYVHKPKQSEARHGTQNDCSRPAQVKSEPAQVKSEPAQVKSEPVVCQPAKKEDAPTKSQPQNAQNHVEETNEDGNADVAFRLSDGRRVKKKVWLTDTVCKLYKIAASYEDACIEKIQLSEGRPPKLLNRDSYTTVEDAHLHGSLIQVTLFD
eukprot:GHVL01037807.1.p1 GENE.GHVL01037807.1~~GHVL01037807.1.p1  ORF type:complete len:285 (+),score=54.22 GHVL01037807.1:394-1248(+)